MESLRLNIFCSTCKVKDTESGCIICFWHRFYYTPNSTLRKSTGKAKPKFTNSTLFRKPLLYVHAEKGVRLAIKVENFTINKILSEMIQSMPTMLSEIIL